MILTREEMTFDFCGARFDLERDRTVLAWIFSQYLYGEVTGVQVGHWLEIAPDFDAAQFLARQANEEMAHVKLFLRILDSLGATPQPPHRALSFLASDFAGATFEEHCLLEMAVGEGFVLTAIYAFIDTLPEGEIRTLMSGLARQEEGHVNFGEEQTLKALARRPALAPHLLGLTLVAMLGVRAIARYTGKRYGDHPVLTQMPSFLAHANRVTELRLQRLGVIDRPLASLGRGERAALMSKATVSRYSRALNPLRRKPTKLTKTYLADPAIMGRFQVRN
ncbi:MAG: ferritin-like domain-containing protein [Actinobacteria bacterium]|nr:MAG: ferritin-like domain-containing protein [Actinomycetota bacterium]